jgi:hypothetical protein
MAKRSALVVPIVITALGVGLLLSQLKLLPDVNWLWTISLAVAGLGVLIAGGLNRFTFVVGPWLLLASLGSVLRQTGSLRTELEAPILFIALGVLWLLAVVLPLRTPAWFRPSGRAAGGGGRA